MDRYLRTLFVLVLVGMALALPASTLAHGGHVGPTQTITQAVGPYDLSITIEIPQGAPAPLYLIVAPQQDIGDATIVLRAAPRGQSFANAPSTQVRTAPAQASYNAQLEIDRAGDWELDVQASGPRGSGTARIPFSVVVAPMSMASVVLLGAIGAVIALMILNVALEGAVRLRGRKLPGWANHLLSYAIFGCVIVAVILGVQQFLDSVQSAQAALSNVAAGRPHVNVALHPAPAAPVAGQPLTLNLGLSDGSTGLPVDDLVPHHDALMHLVVIDADGDFFAHLHPSRVAPGRFSVELSPDRPGRYTAYVEIERQDSGVQVIARDFQVGGIAAGQAQPAPGLGGRDLGDLHVEVSSSAAPLRAGRQATLTFSLRAGSEPVRDLQLWLGMPGHLIARSADGAVFGHIHAAEQLPPAGMEDSVRYGPDIRFVYTFPEPGRYQLWGQFRRAGQIVTVPVTVEVEP
jgi:hypothetical protein